MYSIDRKGGDREQDEAGAVANGTATVVVKIRIQYIHVVGQEKKRQRK